MTGFEGLGGCDMTWAVSEDHGGCGLPQSRCSSGRRRHVKHIPGVVVCEPCAVSGDVPGGQVVFGRQLQRHSSIHDVLTMHGRSVSSVAALCGGAGLQRGPEDVEPARGSSVRARYRLPGATTQAPGHWRLTVGKCDLGITISGQVVIAFISGG
jgi:hypothetical protein